jgi:hypothetical protein
MTHVSIIREPDDELAEVRISLGIPIGFSSFYIVFRGDPDSTILLLRRALAVAERALPKGEYADKRGRLQG